MSLASLTRLSGRRPRALGDRRAPAGRGRSADRRRRRPSPCSSRLSWPRGGLQLERTTDVQIGYCSPAAGLCAAALVRPRPRAPAARRPHRSLAFGLLAAITARLDHLVAVARRTPGSRPTARSPTSASSRRASRSRASRPARWAGLLAGIALAAACSICGYALLTKVFPGALAPDEIYARLREPFGYWNAVGLMAAMGVPPLLWLGARRAGHAAVNALAYPALGLLLVSAAARLLARRAAGAGDRPARSGSRSCRCACAGSSRSAASVVGAAWSSLWAFAQDGADDRQRADGRCAIDAGPRARRAAAARAARAAGSPAWPSASRVAAAAAVEPLRQRAGRGALIASLRARPGRRAPARSPTRPAASAGRSPRPGTQLTDPSTPRTPANTPTASPRPPRVRARYWNEALKIFARGARGVGAGAGGYADARLRYRNDALDVRHAHGYVVQTLADLGWSGWRLSLAPLAAWLRRGARRSALRRRDRGLPWDPERVGLVTLPSVVRRLRRALVVDWTWFVPAQRAPGAALRRLGRRRGPLARAGRARSRRRRCPGACRRAAASGSLRPALAGAGRRRRRSRSSPPGARYSRVASQHARRRRARPPTTGELAAAAVDRARSPRARPAVGRPAVRARRDRAGPRATAAGARRARAGGRPPARQPGDLAPARASCA